MVKRSNSLASAAKEFRNGKFRDGSTPRQQIRRARRTLRAVGRLRRALRQ
jgi:hypothetical protein